MFISAYDLLDNLFQQCIFFPLNINFECSDLCGKVCKLHWICEKILSSKMLLQCIIVGIVLLTPLRYFPSIISQWHEHIYQKAEMCRNHDRLLLPHVLSVSSSQISVCWLGKQRGSRWTTKWDSVTFLPNRSAFCMYSDIFTYCSDNYQFYFF